MSTIERVEVTVPVTWKRETRSGVASRKIGGTAAVFGQTADRLGFAERIERGAFAETIRHHDPFLVYSHNDDAILARKSAGTLTLSEGLNGLNFEAEIVNTTVGNDVLELVRTGHLTECSFAMSDVEDDWVNGERVITRVGQLHEITVCPLGAYSQTSVEGRSSTAARSVERFLGVRTQVRDRSVYGEGSKFSYYRDVSTVELARIEREARVTSMPNRNPGDYSSALPSTIHGGLEDARRRLATIQKRDIGTAGVGLQFSPVDAPYAGSLFETSARARAVIAAQLLQAPLERGGMLVTIPRITTGATTAIQAGENSAVSETDPATGGATGAVKTASGQVDVSQQLFDMTPGGLIDKAISQELGEAVGTGLDVAVVTALLAVSGAVSVVYTDVTPTLAEMLPKLMLLRSNVHVQSGEAPNLLLLHPLRHAWIDSVTDSSLRPEGLEVRFAATVIDSPSVPTNLGVSTTEDRAIYLVTDDVVLFSRPPELRIMAQVLSANLTVRIQVVQYFATVARQPAGVGILSGSGMTQPVL